MKNRKLRALLAGLFLCAAAISAFAEEKSGEEIRLEAGAGELDKKYSEGQQRVVQKIKRFFGVDDACLLGLSYKNLGYGEISIVLGLAQGLPGGLKKDENLHRIVALRQGPPVAGWGKIAGGLGLTLGPVISDIQKISARVRAQENADKGKKAEEKKIIKSKKREKTEKLALPGAIERKSMKSFARS